MRGTQNTGQNQPASPRGLPLLPAVYSRPSSSSQPQRRQSYDAQSLQQPSQTKIQSERRSISFGNTDWRNNLASFGSPQHGASISQFNTQNISQQTRQKNLNQPITLIKSGQASSSIPLLRLNVRQRSTADALQSPKFAETQIGMPSQPRPQTEFWSSFGTTAKAVQGFSTQNIGTTNMRTYGSGQTSYIGALAGAIQNVRAEPQGSSIYQTTMEQRGGGSGQIISSFGSSNPTGLQTLNKIGIIPLSNFGTINQNTTIQGANMSTGINRIQTAPTNINFMGNRIMPMGMAAGPSNQMNSQNIMSNEMTVRGLPAVRRVIGQRIQTQQRTTRPLSLDNRNLAQEKTVGSRGTGFFQSNNLTGNYTSGLNRINTRSSRDQFGSQNVQKQYRTLSEVKQVRSDIGQQNQSRIQFRNQGTKNQIIRGRSITSMLPQQTVFTQQKRQTRTNQFSEQTSPITKIGQLVQIPYVQKVRLFKNEGQKKIQNQTAVSLGKNQQSVNQTYKLNYKAKDSPCVPPKEGIFSKVNTSTISLSNNNSLCPCYPGIDVQVLKQHVNVQSVQKRELMQIKQTKPARKRQMRMEKIIVLTLKYKAKKPNKILKFMRILSHSQKYDRPVSDLRLERGLTLTVKPIKPGKKLGYFKQPQVTMSPTVKLKPLSANKLQSPTVKPTKKQTNSIGLQTIKQPQKIKLNQVVQSESAVMNNVCIGDRLTVSQRATLTDQLSASIKLQKSIQTSAQKNNEIGVGERIIFKQFSTQSLKQQIRQFATITQSNSKSSTTQTNLKLNQATTQYRYLPEVKSLATQQTVQIKEASTNTQQQIKTFNTSITQTPQKKITFIRSIKQNIMPLKIDLMNQIIQTLPIQPLIKQVTVQKIIQIPVEKIVQKKIQIPVEKIVQKFIEVPVEKIVEKRVQIPVQKIVQVPVQKRVQVPVQVPVDRIIQVPVDRIVQVPVDRIVQVPVDRYIQVPVDRYIQVPIQRKIEVPVDRIVQIPVQRIIEKYIQIPVQKIVQVPIIKYIQIPVEIPIEKYIKIPVQVLIQKYIKVPYQVPFEKRVEIPVQKVVQVPVDKYVDRIVEVPYQRVIQVPVDRVVQVPVDRIVEVPVDRVIQVPVQRMGWLQSAQINRLQSQRQYLHGLLKQCQQRQFRPRRNQSLNFSPSQPPIKLIGQERFPILDIAQRQKQMTHRKRNQRTLNMIRQQQHQRFISDTRSHSDRLFNLRQSRLSMISERALSQPPDARYLMDSLHPIQQNQIGENRLYLSNLQERQRRLSFLKQKIRGLLQNQRNLK